MPRGKGRRAAPPGYLTAAEAGELLGYNRIYRLKEDGRLHRYTPPGHTHGYYDEKEVRALYDAERTFFEATKGGPVHNQDAVFTYATLGDMDALYACAKKFFARPANAEVRRGWMRKEPRGHYLMKRIADGAVVAYMYLLALKPDYLDDYMHGRLPGRMITSDHIERFEPGKLVQACIINAIQSDPEVEAELRKTYVAMLLRGVRKDMGELGREGIIIPHIYAWSESAEGIALCARLGMEPWQPPHGKRCFFVLDTEQAASLITRDYRHGLAEWRQKHPSEEVSPSH